MRWLKEFIWFLSTSRDFLGCSLFSVIKQGGISKGIAHANFMVKYNKWTPAQREAWYLSEDRTIEF